MMFFHKHPSVFGGTHSEPHTSLISNLSIKNNQLDALETEMFKKEFGKKKILIPKF